MFEDLKKGLYQTFILDDNYQYFIKGIQTTLIVTVFALILGVILGVIIAIIRSAHDQQPERKKNIFLRIANLICQIYLTVIRGTDVYKRQLLCLRLPPSGQGGRHLPADCAGTFHDGRHEGGILFAGQLCIPGYEASTEGLA